MRRLKISHWLLATGIVCHAAVFADQPVERVRYDDHRLVQVTLTSQEDIETMLRISRDHWSEGIGIGTFPFRVAPENMAALEKSGLSFEIVHDNIQALIDQQRPARLAEPRGWFDDYKTYDEIDAYVDMLVALRPDLVTRLNLGQSIEGRTIYGMRISNLAEGSDAPAVLFNGTQHAREWITPMTNMYIADMLVQAYDTDPEIQSMVDSVVFYIVPVVNPDGYVYSWDVNRMWRKNRRDNEGACFGVDNNRNWGVGWGDDAGSSGDPCHWNYRGTAPFSEPENQAVRDFILAHPAIVTHIDFHSYGQVILSRYSYITEEPPEPDRTIFRDLNGQMATAIYDVHGETYTAGPGAMTLYTVSGGCADWAYVDQDIFSWTFELRDTGEFHFLLPADQIIPTGEENFEVVKVLAEYVLTPFAFSFPDGLLPTCVPPDTQMALSLHIREIGETVDPDSAWVMTRVGSSGPFTPSSLTSLGGSLYEAALPAAPCGSLIQYYFHAESTIGSVLTSPDDAPATLYETVAFETVVLISDDMETESGWIVGAPDDDATTGVWVRVDPNGTEAQPEDDHTPSGTMCWVTGQGEPGGESWVNDVDGGKTTLTSPALDLADQDAVISYWRWYSNNTGATPNTDIFVVDISDDGGSSWTNVETVGPSGQGTSGGWLHHEFKISDFIDPGEQVQVRFVASDEGDGSLVEAAIDDFTVLLLDCGPQLLSVVAEGSRYLVVRPPSEAEQVALRLTSPDYPCVPKYVAPGGILVNWRTLQSPGEWGTVAVHGMEIIPETTYVVQPEDESGADVGEPGTATTERWGDVAGDSVGGHWTPPDGTVDFQDITATVDRFRNLPGAPPWQRCDIAPAIPDGIVDFTDIPYVVDAFRDLPYPFDGPCP